MNIRPNQARRRWRSDSPGWMFSAVLHALLLIVLGLFGYSVESKRTLLMMHGEFTDQTSDELQILVLDALTSRPTPPIVGDESEVVDRLGKTETESSLINVPPMMEWKFEIDVGHTNSTLPLTATLLELHKSSASTIVNSTRPLSETLDGRNLQRKKDLVAKYGGSAASEAAVHRALHWIAAHQDDDGGWSFAHNHVCNGQCNAPGRFGQSRNGATAMGLLPFLGAGHTHKVGDYKKTVNDGLRYLVEHLNRPDAESSMPRNLHGSWFEPGGTMYSHCLATIAMCEAYAMTNDSYLRGPAQFGINFLVRAQNKVGGGWRYAPGDRGDTSVVGWAVMALKSGKIGGLDVPEPTLTLANQFLDRVGSNKGARYGYMEPEKNPHGLAATTSIGLLCRMYDGWPRTYRGLRRGVNTIADIGPSVDELYYSYYATQVMHHYGGSEWEKWNAEMRDPLVRRQAKEGHASGSWTPNRKLDGMVGGRLYATAMATMILEVYYRHMPLYTDQVLDDDFQL